MRAAALLGDPGVLVDCPTLAVDVEPLPTAGDFLSVRAWRRPYLADRRAGRPARVYGIEAVAGGYVQAVVAADKSREATLAACAWAWGHLAAGGRLVLVGENRGGIKATARRVGEAGAGPGETVACRAHARAVAFVRAEDAGDLDVPPAPTVLLPLADGDVELASAPGVFSADALDRGTSLLLDAMDGLPAPARVVDCCCGIGPLGVAALDRWPACRVTFLDADARAVACVQRTLDDCACLDRSTVSWWDAAEGVPWLDGGVDLVLLNPPWHAGTAADVDLGRSLLRLLPDMLAPGGRALVVANRKLPYEAQLAGRGAVEVRTQAEGYKIIEFVTG